jgi:FtsH-binding integral membrane protein
VEAALGLALAALALALGHLGRHGEALPRVLLGVLTALWGLVGGLLGTGLFVMGAFTNHSVTHHNENLFLWNPLTLALLPLGVMLAFGSRRAPRGLLWTWTALGGLTALGVLLKALPAFDQANWNLVLLLGPVNLAFAALQWLTVRQRARSGVAPAREAAAKAT